MCSTHGREESDVDEGWKWHRRQIATNKIGLRNANDATHVATVLSQVHVENTWK
jgi:hypothetical protein